MPDVYSIDGTDVNDRLDWRHTTPVAPVTATREEGFPGSGVTFTIIGSQRGARLSVTGWLQGLDFKALHQQTEAAGRLRTDGETHTVRIHDATYRDCQLIDFRVTGANEPFLRDDNTWMRCPVLYVWQQVTTEGVS